MRTTLYARAAADADVVAAAEVLADQQLHAAGLTQTNPQLCLGHLHQAGLILRCEEGK